MLCYQLKNNYIITTQHSHGIFAGKLATHLKGSCFIDNIVTSLDPFPFGCPFEMSLEYKSISIERARSQSIAKAYSDMPPMQKVISFVGS